MKNYGFIPPEYITSDQYVRLGGTTKVPSEVLVPDGNWKPWRPQDEIQRNEFFDSFNCTGYGTAKAIRAYMLRKFAVDFNPSERWIGIVAGTQPPGNDPHTVMEAIRKYGLIPESMLPFDSSITTIEDYFSFKGADEKECRKEAKRWLEQWDFKHEYLFYPMANVSYKQEQIRQWITSSPINVSVVAWKERDGLYYKEIGEQDTHWTTEESKTETNNIQDSYPEYEKRLENLYDFSYAKRIYISKREPKESCFQTFLEAFGFKKTIRTLGRTVEPWSS